MRNCVCVLKASEVYYDKMNYR